MEIEISTETQKFIKTASDREVQNQIYVTLRKIQILQERSVKILSIIEICMLISLLSAILIFVFAIGPNIK